MSELTEPQLRALKEVEAWRVTWDTRRYPARVKLKTAHEHPEGITEWRWFAGDEGDSKYELDHGEPRRSREEAEADLASMVAEADPPYDHQGIESRQCGPWVESSRTVGQEDR